MFDALKHSDHAKLIMVGGTVFAALVLATPSFAKTVSREICSYNTVINTESAVTDGSSPTGLDESLLTQLNALKQALGHEVTIASSEPRKSYASENDLEENCITVTWQEP
jgi:hypothetical protein